MRFQFLSAFCESGPAAAVAWLYAPADVAAELSLCERALGENLSCVLVNGERREPVQALDLGVDPQRPL